MAEECNHKNLYTACDLKTKQNKTCESMCELIPTKLVLRDATQIKARYLHKGNGNQSAWRYLDKSKNSRKCR